MYIRQVYSIYSLYIYDTALDRVLNIQPKTYEYKDVTNRGTKRVYGSISQQIAEIIKRVYGSIPYTLCVPLLVKM